MCSPTTSPERRRPLREWRQRRASRPGRPARLALIVLTWPLLQTLTCLDRLQISLIEGFFRAFNPWLIERYQRELDKQPGPGP